MRAFVGGAFQKEAFALDDAALGKMASRSLRSLLAIRSDPLFISIRRYERGIPQYPVGHLARVASIERELARYPGLYLTGNGLRGMGIPDCVRQAEQSAERIVEFLKEENNGI